MQLWTAPLSPEICDLPEPGDKLEKGGPDKRTALEARIIKA